MYCVDATNQCVSIHAMYCGDAIKQRSSAEAKTVVTQ